MLPSSYHVSGVILDETGSPIAGAPVDILSPATRFTTRADGGGAYTVEDVPHAAGFAAMLGVFAVVMASAPDHWENVQPLPIGSSNVTRDLRLRRIKKITSGGSITVLMDDYSSFVGVQSGEDWVGAPVTFWNLAQVQERFIVDDLEAGQLLIQADDADDGSGFPFLHACRIVSSGCEEEASGQGQMSFRVGGGERYEISVRVPPRPDAPRRYTIRTSRTP